MSVLKMMRPQNEKKKFFTIVFIQIDEIKFSFANISPKLFAIFVDIYQIVQKFSKNSQWNF